MEFESVRDIEARRQEKREARERLLENAQRKYEKEERRKEVAKSQGEGTWMLPGLSDKLDNDAQELKDKKSKLKKEKKVKKEKKKKNEKKKHHKKGQSESEDEWIEKVKTPPARPPPDSMETSAEHPAPTAEVKDKPMQRDDWMMFEGDVPTVTRDELRDKIKQDKAHYAALSGSKVLDEPGQHEKELNPYWKSGEGTGLPEEEQKVAADKKSKYSLKFLQNSYARCQQQAESGEGTLDELAAERFGSLERLEILIMEAEREEQLKNKTSSTEDWSSRRRHRSRSPPPKSKRRAFMKPGDDRNDRSNRSSSRERHRSRSRERRRSRSRERRRSRSRERRRSRSRERRRSRSRERRRSQDRTRSRERRTRSRDRKRSRDRRSRSQERRRSRDQASRSRSQRSRSRDGVRKRSASPVSKKRAFMKPGEASSFDLKDARSKHGTDQKPAWKKQPSNSDLEDGNTNMTPAAKPVAKPTPIKQREPSPSSSSSSSAEESSEPEEEATPAPVVLLTKSEMNALGAKILRAEMMGNQEVMTRLKAELEAAREAHANAPKEALAAAAAAATTTNNRKEKVVVLTKTDRHGNIRPVDEKELRVTERKDKRQRRKDKKATNTHNTDGERQKYFPDDDGFNIADMVRSEKLTTAQDQQALFSKLAGRMGGEKTNDDDRTLDDVLVEKAAAKNVTTSGLNRDSAASRAIKEQKVLDGCERCLDNTKKHLIVAVGNKVYLRVPAHKSLTEGHCQIVPITHTTCSTSCDEEVWEEVMKYRRSLVEMCKTDDQGVVFLECSMKLRKQPHMTIDCIPVPMEVDEMAPIYFKKAILECETDWSQNKKLVQLRRDRDLRHAVPRGFPYFAVDFGLDPGFAHVIEDEQLFPHYFGKEVVGGMLDVEPNLWRNPWKCTFEEQRVKVMNFARKYKQFDWTISKEDDSPSAEEKMEEDDLPKENSDQSENSSQSDENKNISEGV